MSSNSEVINPEDSDNDLEVVDVEIRRIYMCKICGEITCGIFDFRNHYHSRHVLGQPAPPLRNEELAPQLQDSGSEDDDDEPIIVQEFPRPNNNGNVPSSSCDNQLDDMSSGESDDGNDSERTFIVRAPKQFFVCNTCEHVFTSLESLEQHQITAHGGNSRRIGGSGGAVAGGSQAGARRRSARLAAGKRKQESCCPGCKND